MKTRLRFLCLAALAGPGLALAGCATGGVGGRSDVGPEAASRQVAAAVFVQEWAQLLWGLRTAQTSTEPPVMGPPVFHPDGSITQTITGADKTVGKLTVFKDGSARLDMTYPDGMTQRVLQSVPAKPDKTHTIIDWTVTTSEGLAVTYRTVVDNRGTITDMSDDTTDVRGTSVLPDKQRQDFHVFTGSGQSQVASRQSDGSDFALQVPLAKPDYARPEFAQPSVGSYTRGGSRLRFTLESSTAASQRWAAMSSDLGGGLSVRSALDPDFSGSGRLLQAGEVIALLSWARTGAIQVSFLTAGRRATSPAGAAVDFLIHRWQTLAALMAPVPGGRSTTAMGQVVPFDVPLATALAPASRDPRR